MNMKAFLLWLVALCCVGCQPYQPIRHQGNVDLKSALKHVKLGMTKTKVAALAGAPIGVDPFDEDHWTYWQLDSQYGQIHCKIGKSLVFKKERLVAMHTIGDACPATKP